jgi:hypothetical protein
LLPQKKEINATYFECVSVYRLSYPACNARPPYCNVACLAEPYFSTLSHERYDFRGKVTEMVTYVLIYSTLLSETLLILRRTERDIVIPVSRSSCEAPLLVSGSNETGICWTEFQKNIQI